MSLEAIGEDFGIDDSGWGQSIEWESSWMGRDVSSRHSSLKIPSIVSSALHHCQKASSLHRHTIGQLYIDDEDDEFFNDLFGSREVYGIHFDKESSLRGRDMSEFFTCCHRKKRRGFRGFIHWCVRGVKKAGKAIANGVKTLFHGVEKVAEKVKDFVKDHKKEVIITAAVITAVVATILTVGAATAPAVAATTAAAGATLKEEEKKEIASAAPPPPSSGSDPDGPRLTSLGNTIASVLVPGSNLISPDIVDPGLSKIAHEFWNQYMAGNSEFIRLGSFFDSLADKVGISNLTGSGNKEQAWKERFVEGHKKIDQLFGTSFAEGYNPETHIDYPAELLSLLIVPGEGGLASRVGDPKLLSAQINKIVALAEKESVVTPTRKGSDANLQALRRVSQELEGRVVIQEKLFSDLVKIQENGVWEIQGKNIKRFNPEPFYKKTLKADHVFNKEHQLEKIHPDRKIVLDKITNGIIEADKAGRIPQNKRFEIRIPVDGFEVEVHGIVLDGQLRYGTFFIPKK